MYRGDAQQRRSVQRSAARVGDESDARTRWDNPDAHGTDAEARPQRNPSRHLRLGPCASRQDRARPGMAPEVRSTFVAGASATG